MVRTYYVYCFNHMVHTTHNFIKWRILHIHIYHMVHTMYTFFNHMVYTIHTCLSYGAYYTYLLIILCILHTLFLNHMVCVYYTHFFF